MQLAVPQFMGNRESRVAVEHVRWPDRIGVARRAPHLPSLVVDGVGCDDRVADILGRMLCVQYP